MEISRGFGNLFFCSSSSGLRDRWYGSSLRRTLKVIQLSAGESESDPQRPPAGTKERKLLEMLFHFNFIAIPRRFGKLKVTLNVELLWAALERHTALVTA